MKKVFFTLLSIYIVLSLGCAANLKTRYPDFYKPDAHSSKIDVVIDSIVLSDIAGTDIGISEEKNAKAVASAKESLIENLKKRGFEPNVLIVGNGLYHQLEEGKRYFYSEDFKSTEREYQGAVVSDAQSYWASNEVKAFVDNLFERAQSKLKSKRKRKKYSQASSLKARKLEEQNSLEPLNLLEIPQVILNSPSNTIVFVKAYCGDVSMGKSIGTGIATGVVTALLTGGMYSYVATPVSGSSLEVLVLDKQKNKIAWYNKAQAGNYKHLDNGIRIALQYFPDVEGKVISRAR